MSERDRPVVDLSQVGAWISPTVFEFFEPQELAPGAIAQRIDVSLFTGPDGITPQEAIEALLYPVGIAQVDVDGETRDITCAGCGRVGRAPREWPEDRPAWCVTCFANGGDEGGWTS